MLAHHLMQTVPRLHAAPRLALGPSRTPRPQRSIISRSIILSDVPTVYDVVKAMFSASAILGIWTASRLTYYRLSNKLASYDEVAYLAILFTIVAILLAILLDVKDIARDITR